MKYQMKDIIIDSIIQKLEGTSIKQEADIKKIGDNIDEQTQNVIICGISSMNKVYPMTQDYEYKLDIAVRSWIAGDENGEGFQRVCEALEYELSPLNDNKTMKDIFKTPVVGVVNEGQIMQVTDDSNIMTLSYLVYVSF